MIWPEKLYQFTKVQGVITTYTLAKVDNISEGNFAFYCSNYNQTYHISEADITNYYISLESCYEAWIESIEKFKQKVIKQFENKCKIDYYEYNMIQFRKFLDEDPDIKSRVKKLKDEMG